MKKFISMVLAAAMAVSLVPATAFAANAASFKVLDAHEWTADEAKTEDNIAGPEIQIKVKDVDTKIGENDDFEITLDFEDAELQAANWEDGHDWTAPKVMRVNENAWAEVESFEFTLAEAEAGDSSITVTLTENGEDLAEGDMIVIPIDGDWILSSTSAGTVATVEVGGDFGTSTAMPVVTIMDKALKVSVKKLVDVAEEEVKELDSKGLKIESKVGNFADDQEITLKTSKGFEFTKAGAVTVETDGANGTASISKTDDNELTIKIDGTDVDELLVKGIEIEATTAKAGATCTIKASSKGWDASSVEVAKVVDYKVNLTVDEDEDVPVFYSGVNVDNKGLTVDDDHMSLEVTAEETFPGAWSMRKGFNFELPEGVYVTDVKVKEAKNFEVDTKVTDATEWRDAFWNAYKDGDHVNFEFAKRVFDDVDSTLAKKAATVTFQLELVADPTFEGDVVLKLTGDLVDEQTVTIAKFVKPYTVKAEQNDLKIDYRYTEVPTVITVTEAEAGLWEDKGTNAAVFTFGIDDHNIIEFEDDATYEVDEDSEMEVKDLAGGLGFKVTECSEDEPAVVTIKDIELFMQRNIPAGPYDLSLTTTMSEAYDAQVLFAPDANTDPVVVGDSDDAADAGAKPFANATGAKEDSYVADVCDYSDTVKEAFINVITAGRETDDASFTTKVVVPVGESYLIAGENQIALDVPAYINAAGYTMLPVRAVATALGINNSNVLWDGPTKTVTILYGQRIITMVAGQKVVYVNGSAIPASASVEIVDGRTFLPMRDLATALGVTDITWDAATKTATLNGNQK